LLFGKNRTKQELIVPAEDPEQTQLVKKLVNESLLTQIHNRILLQKEGFYQSNLNN
jgi:hypothetical protein